MSSMKPAAVPLAILAIAISVACGGGGSGISRSQSSGSGWQEVNLPSSVTQVNYVAFNGSDHWFIADRVRGFYRSTDQGATWVPINSGIATTLGWTINVNPANGDLIASTFSGGALNANPVNFYLSTDEGNSWSLIPTGHLSSVTALTGCVFAANANIVCGGYWAPSSSSGAWVSANGGQTTMAATTSAPNGGSVLALGHNPVAQDLWMGTEQEGVFRSTDNGFTWSQASPPDQQIDPVHGIRDANIYGITFDRNGNVLFSSQGGVWKSSKSGAGYTWANVLKNSNTSAGKGMARDANGNLYYGHNQDSMDPVVVYRSTDDGGSWSAYDAGIPSGLQARQFAVDPVDRKLYAVIVNEGNGGWLYRTVNTVQ
jgi:hypothetical protein